MIHNAYAKLNLALAVKGARPDGYHLLDTIFCRIDLCDTLEISETDGGSLSIACNWDAIASENNLALRAAKLFSEKSGVSLSLCVNLQKRIPVQAGLGGGSADAAAVLKALNCLHPTFTDRQLADLSVALGADVPYMLNGGFARAGGIGEVLSPFSVPEPLHFVVVKPEQGLSTPAVFARYDGEQDAPQPDIASAVAALSSGDLWAFSAFAQNALQQSAQGLCPEIGSLCEKLLATGALCACMTGTGSAAYGLFVGEEAAKKARRILQSAAPFCALAHSIIPS